MSAGAKLFSGKIKREGKEPSSDNRSLEAAASQQKLSFQPLLLPLLRASSKKGAVYKKLRGVPGTANPAPFILPSPATCQNPEGGAGEAALG